jgi:hypothetical protein
MNLEEAVNIPKTRRETDFDSYLKEQTCETQVASRSIENTNRER